MTYRFNIKKQYCERYQIVWVKLYQHKYYKMVELGKYKIVKYRTGKYEYLVIFRKSCQYYNIFSQLLLEM